MVCVVVFARDLKHGHGPLHYHMTVLKHIHAVVGAWDVE
jgi:hypothetical protein